MRVSVEGIGLRGPGLDGWVASRAALTGTEPYLPAPAAIPPSPLLPANERRRTVLTVKLALAVGSEAIAAARSDATTMATVFTSSGGDGDTIHGILEALATDEPELSPTRFHNSVHNAPAGYWSIATGSQAPSSSLCCHDGSFAAGLVEAAVQATVDDRPVTLIAYDLPYPEPLNSVRRIGGVFGVALVLTPGESDNALAVLDIAVGPETGAATPMEDAEFETLRLTTPAAQSLPLLAAIARHAPQTLNLDYVPGLQLALVLAEVGTAPQ